MAMAGTIGKVVLLLAITAMANSMCSNPRQIMNGRWNATFTQHKLETWVKWEFSCFPGYSLVGSRTMFCQPDGKWSSDVPNCVKGRVGTKIGGYLANRMPARTGLDPLMCPNLQLPPFSKAKIYFRRQSLEIGTRVVVSCYDGFTLVGNNEIICQSSGRWSGGLPKCIDVRNIQDEPPAAASVQVFCEDPGIPPGSQRFSHFAVNELEEGAKMVFACDDGLKMEGSDSTTCLPTGLWSSPVPKCLDDTEFLVDSTSSTSLSFCEDPGLPQSSSIFSYFTNNELETGAKMVFTCNDGFKMKGSNTTTCLPTRQWSSPVPNCLRDDVDTHSEVSVHSTLTCDDPGVPMNSIRSPLVSQFNLGSFVKYTCNDGFDLQGTSTLVCIYHGKWSSSPPECISNNEKGICKLPQHPKNGKFSIEFSPKDPNDPIKLTADSQIKYTCAENYHLDGPERRVCLNHGDWSGPDPRCVINCGTSKGSQRPFIINGEVSKLGQWPWQAGIALDGSLLAKIFPQAENIIFPTPGGSRGIICGGSLISDEWVLTAAHCVTVDQTTDKYSVVDVSVYIGKHFRDPVKDDNFVQLSRVTDIFVHEDFNRRLLIADIAMIRMEKLAKFSDRVLPICLPMSSRSVMNDDGKGVVSGWGNTEGTVSSDELKHGVLRLADSSKCEQISHGQSPTEASRVQEDQFCTETVTSFNGYSCYGDSGGPLVFEETIGGQKKWVIQGIVSWGNKNCSIDSGVYIRVHYYIKWLQRFMKIDD